MIWIIVFGGLISCTGKLVGASCLLKLSPPRVVVRYGDSLLATCSSPSDVEGIGWESSYGGTGLRKGVTSLPLKIDSVNDWVIDPQCYATLKSDGDQCIVDLPVTVYKLPKSVSVMQFSNETGPIVEDQEYHMICDVLDVAPAKNLTVQWYNGSGVIYTQSFNEPSLHPVNVSSVLKQTAHRVDDGSKVFCGVTLHLGLEETSVLTMVSKSQQVSILYPPSFVKPGNEMVEIPPGRIVDLDCTASGNPAPTYSWDFPNSPQGNSQNSNFNIPILRPDFQVPGIYSCLASNSQGNSTKYFTVIKGPEDLTTFAAILGVFGVLGVLLLISGLFLVNQNGTVSFNKGSSSPSGII